MSYDSCHCDIIDATSLRHCHYELLLVTPLRYEVELSSPFRHYYYMITASAAITTLRLIRWLRHFGARHTHYAMACLLFSPPFATITPLQWLTEGAADCIQHYCHYIT